MLSSGSLHAGLPGGYSNISVMDSQVQNAANFATMVINNGQLKHVITAESQVVAGINYKLTLEIVDPTGILHNYRVIVFVPLPSSNQSMQVTSYEEIVND